MVGLVFQVNPPGVEEKFLLGGGRFCGRAAFFPWAPRRSGLGWRRHWYSAVDGWCPRSSDHLSSHPFYETITILAIVGPDGSGGESEGLAPDYI